MAIPQFVEHGLLKIHSNLVFNCQRQSQSIFREA